MTGARILIVVNAEWYFWSHRLAFARALRERGHDVVIAAAVERGMGSRIEADGFRFVQIPFVRGRLAALADVRAWFALVRLYQEERPDLLYHTTIKPILYGSLAASVARLARRVNAIPGLGQVFAPTSLSARLRLWCVSTAYRLVFMGRRVRVIFQNDDDRRLFVEQRLVRAAQSIVIRGSGVNLSQFFPTPEPASAEPPQYRSR